MKVVDPEAMSDISVTINETLFLCMLSKVTAVKRDCWGNVMRDDSNVDCVVNLSVFIFTLRAIKRRYLFVGRI